MAQVDLAYKIVAADDSVESTPAAPRKSYSKLLRPAVGWIVPGVALTAWSLASHHAWVAPQILPAPGTVWQTLLEQARSGDLFVNFGISLGRVLVGFALGCVIGVALGVAMGLSRRVEDYISPTFNAISQIPVLGWLPLAMMLLGIGESLKFVIIAHASLVPVAINTLKGIRSVPRNYIEVAKAFQFSRRQLLRKVVFPATVPSIFVGLRYGLTQAWLSLVTVELLASSEGLGFLIVWGRQLFQLDLVLAAIIVVGVVGLLLDRGLAKIEQRLLRWRRVWDVTGGGVVSSVAASLASPRLRRGIVLPLAALVLWQLITHYKLANVHLLASPSAVLKSLAVQVKEGELLPQLLASLRRDLSGFAIGALAGLLLGSAMGSWRIADRLFGPSLDAAKQVAVFAWIPLISVWFGTGEPAKIVFIALAAFYPVVVNTHEGIRSVSREHSEVARAFRFSRRQIFKRVVLPAALPSIFSGLHLALIYSWLGTLGAEYLLAPGPGIGNLMIDGREALAMDKVLLGVILAGLVGFSLNTIAARAEAYFLRWRVRNT